MSDTNRRLVGNIDAKEVGRRVRENDHGPSLPPLNFWKATGATGHGYITYAPGVLEREGPFTNPARMIEDIMGASTNRNEFTNGDCQSSFNARVWAHAGWWDPGQDKPPGKE